MRSLAAVLAVALLVGCSGGDDAGRASSTNTTERARTTTTRAPTPEEAFEDDLRSQVSVSGDEAEFLADSLDLGQTLCGQLEDLPEDIAEDDAANDTPESDAAIGGLVQTMAVASAMDGFDNKELGAVVLRATAEHLCPNQATPILDLLEARNL